MKGHLEEQAVLVAIVGLMQDENSCVQREGQEQLVWAEGKAMRETTVRLPVPRVTPYSGGFWNPSHTSLCNNPPFPNELPPISAIRFVH